MKKQMNKAIFLTCLSSVLMVVSLIRIWNAKSNNEIMGGIIAFILCGVLGILSIWDINVIGKRIKNNKL